MLRAIISAIALCGVFTDSSAADDYLLRVDVVGYENVPIPAEDVPKPLTLDDVSHPEQTLHSLELLVQPGVPFRTKTTISNRTISCDGKLTLADDGTHSIRLEFRNVLDTGETAPVSEHEHAPILDVRAVNATISVELAKPIMIGGALTRHDADRGSHQSKVIHILTLKKYNPEED